MELDEGHASYNMSPRGNRAESKIETWETGEG